MAAVWLDNTQHPSPGLQGGGSAAVQAVPSVEQYNKSLVELMQVLGIIGATINSQPPMTGQTRATSCPQWCALRARHSDNNGNGPASTAMAMAAKAWQEQVWSTQDKSSKGCMASMAVVMMV